MSGKTGFYFVWVQRPSEGFGQRGDIIPLATIENTVLGTNGGGGQDMVWRSSKSVLKGQMWCLGKRSRGWLTCLPWGTRRMALFSHQPSRSHILSLVPHHGLWLALFWRDAVPPRMSLLLPPLPMSVSSVPNATSSFGCFQKIIMPRGILGIQMKKRNL